jgi:hypothetical protein
MIGRLEFEPAFDARLHFAERVAAVARALEKSGDELVEFKSGVERAVFRELAHIDATALTRFEPAAPFEFAVGGADGVGVNLKTAREFARARQALAGLEIAADDAEHDLRRQLLADRDFAIFGEPETHEKSRENKSSTGQRQATFS